MSLTLSERHGSFKLKAGFKLIVRKIHKQLQIVKYCVNNDMLRDKQPVLQYIYYVGVSQLIISYESHLHYIKCTHTQRVFAKALVL